jgi:hypothetical protein
MRKFLFLATTFAVSSSGFGQTNGLSLETAFRIAFDGSSIERTERGMLSFEPKKLIQVGSQLALISEGTNEDDCHACSGALSIHYLQEKDDGWHVTGAWLDIAGGTTWGEPAIEWSVSINLLSSPVLYSESGGTWQGCSSSVAQLVPLLPEGIGEPTDIPISFDNEGGFGDLQSAEGKITKIMKDVGFTVSFAGQKRGKKWLASDRYSWNGKTFTIAGSRSLETC